MSPQIAPRIEGTFLILYYRHNLTDNFTISGVQKRWAGGRDKPQNVEFFIKLRYFFNRVYYGRNLTDEFTLSVVGMGVGGSITKTGLPYNVV